jgi:3-carboxy-cis,cis-muconate cycloisomerase
MTEAPMATADEAGSLFSARQMDAVFSLERQLQHMVEFERALALALESCGIAGPGAARPLETLRDASFLDIGGLKNAALQAGNLAIPFVRQLTEAAFKIDAKAANYVHWGATSQDLLDTALVLQMREAFEILFGELARLDLLLRARTEQYAGTIMAGRTWLQDGPPITLGLKIAGWLSAVDRSRARIEAAAGRALMLQFGGAVGTLAALGEKGPRVSAALAHALDLPEPAAPWHAHRDNLAEVAACLGVLTGTLGKVARDVSLLMQTQVGEALEGRASSVPGASGRGGSSTMPHKRNPVACAVILSAAARVPALVSTMLHAMVQEHERGLGGWHAEWETLPEIFRLTSVALACTVEIAEGLEVHPERMRANLDALSGLGLSEAVSIALAEHVGRPQAHKIMEEASKRAVQDRLPLLEVLEDMPEVVKHIRPERLAHLLKAENYLGSTAHFIARALGKSRS